MRKSKFPISKETRGGGGVAMRARCEETGDALQSEKPPLCGGGDLQEMFGLRGGFFDTLSLEKCLLSRGKQTPSLHSLLLAEQIIGDYRGHVKSSSACHELQRRTTNLLHVTQPSKEKSKINQEIPQPNSFYSHLVIQPIISFMRVKKPSLTRLKFPSVSNKLLYLMIR